MRRQHAVAGHDDGEGVAPERLAHRARRARLAEPLRDLAIAQRGAGCDVARDLVDATMEGRYVRHVQRHVEQVARLAAQQCTDVVDRALHGGGRHGLARTGQPPPHARAQRLLIRFGQPHAGDAVLAPRDAARAERRVEDGTATKRAPRIRLCRSAGVAPLRGSAEGASGVVHFSAFVSH